MILKVLYISSSASYKQFKYITTLADKDKMNGIYGMPEASFKFNNLIINGIALNGAEVYSLIGRPVSYSMHKKIFWKKKVEKSDKITYHHVGFINLPIIKQICISIMMFINILVWLVKNYNDKEKIIIYDGAYVSLIPLISLATFLFRCKKVPIICDIYSYMANVNDSRENISFKTRIVSKVISWFLSQADGYVFLTDEMAKVINTKNKPYIVVEGIVDNSPKIFENKKTNKKKIIMYAGALKKEYGLENLIKGFMDFNNKEAELWIFGAGSYSNDIINYQKKDCRIKFYGSVSNEEILEKEQQATLLINPRPIDKEFVKYSFPSKNMEYMASGTPVLTTKLPGMPKEYYDYIYTIDGNDASSITNALKGVFHNNLESLKEKGKKAQEFVLEKKNNVFQSKRIIEFCNKVNEEIPIIKPSNKFINYYLQILMVCYILFSRNTLYTSLILGTRTSTILLFVLSLPMIVIYVKYLLKNMVSRHNLFLFITFISFICLSILFTKSFIFFNINLLMTISICFIISQLISKQQFIKTFIRVMLFICFFSLINQYIVKNVIIEFNLFEKLGNTILVKENIGGVYFLNLITSFVVYQENYMRNFAIFNEPSFFQFYLIMAMVLLEDYKCSQKNKKLILGLFIITIISTFSTTGYILLLVYMLLNYKQVYSYFKKKMINKKNLIVLAIILTILCIIVLNNEYLLSTLKFSITKLFSNNASSSTRVVSTLFSLKCILNSLILGVNSNYYLNEVITTNTPGSIWAMYGIVPFLLFIVYSIKMVLTKKRKMFYKIGLLILFILSICSHFFLNDHSFWLIVFIGIMEVDKYENIMDC